MSTAHEWSPEDKRAVAAVWEQVKQGADEDLQEDLEHDWMRYFHAAMAVVILLCTISIIVAASAYVVVWIWVRLPN